MRIGPVGMLVGEDIKLRALINDIYKNIKEVENNVY